MNGDRGLVEKIRGEDMGDEDSEKLELYDNGDEMRVMTFIQQGN